ncbi:MAG: helix-turn-helix domain-containing protein [Actinomycetota bacterium]
MDPLLLGRRIRFFRKEAGLTLDDVSAKVDRPTSYLSQLENGHVEARIGLLGELAAALGCTSGDLMVEEAPTQRDELEIGVIRAQHDPRYLELGLPEFKPTAKTSDSALEHIASLWSALCSAEDSAGERDGDHDRRANVEMRAEMRARNNYFGEIEDLAAKMLAEVGYPGRGPVSERMLVALAENCGFRIDRVRDLPSSSRSVADQRNRVIYIPQRDDLTTRNARSVVLQTLGHFVLGHRDSDNFLEYVRQRVESNYFAAAVLAPEAAAVEHLQEAKEARDISVEDIKELFYISYEMAGHRLTNLATEHLDITLHFMRSDNEGVVWKAYENDDLPLPIDPFGGVEGQRLCREFGTRQAFHSEDAYALHYQWTDTSDGEFWCVTYVETDRSPHHAITVGTDARQAKYFRGSDTTRRTVSQCPDPACCREPHPSQRQRWSTVAWPSARDRSHILSGLPAAREPFKRFPGVDLVEVYSFLDRRSE